MTVKPERAPAAAEQGQRFLPDHHFSIWPGTTPAGEARRLGFFSDLPTKWRDMREPLGTAAITAPRRAA
ncbi:MAG: hypothetical protein M3Z75_13325 [Actinomycetota bacterium]|nr:hypothetical protein [Actinomycetota bacterium]